jgi:hypothetical protein
MYFARRVTRHNFIHAPRFPSRSGNNFAPTRPNFVPADEVPLLHVFRQFPRHDLRRQLVALDPKPLAALHLPHCFYSGSKLVPAVKLPL